MANNAMAEAGFAAITRSPRRLIASVQSIKKSVGKTRFAFTGKKPVGYISVEIGSEEGVADSFIPSGASEYAGIQIVRIRMDSPNYPDPSAYNMDNRESSKKYDAEVCAAVQDVANPAIDAFYKAYYASLANCATTVIDTSTDLYRLIRLANFGRTEKIPQLAYTAVNNDFAKLMDDAFSHSGSVLFLTHMKDRGEYVDDGKGGKKWQASGVYDADTCKVVNDKVQAVIEFWREDLPEGNPETGRLVKFNAQIIDARQNADAMGTVFTDDAINFASIGKAIFPSTKYSDWE